LENWSLFDVWLLIIGILKMFMNMKLKIMVIGPIYGGSLPTANYTASALKNMGHEVEFLDFSIFKDSYFDIDHITKDDEHRRALKDIYINFLGEAAMAKASSFMPELIIALAQAPLTPNIIQRLKGGGASLAFWFVEDYRTLSYWRNVAPHYDYFFAIQRGIFFDELKKAGAKNYRYLPQACSPEIHKRVLLSEEDKRLYSSDISFMGAGYHNRKVFFQGLMDFDFKIWGTEWDYLSPLSRHIQKNGERLPPEEYVKIFNASKINLNLHSSSYHEGVDPVGDFVNPRTFELASCGAFQLVDYRAEFDGLFKIGEEIICFRDLRDIREKIRYYLDNSEEREKIAEKARERALKYHTFEKRMEEMLEFIFEREGDKFINRIQGVKDSRGQGVNNVERMIKEAGGATELGKFLSQFKAEKELSIKSVVKAIEDGNGSLTRPEAIFLMMEQFLTEK
jgi:spore maturation protein CgeB